MPLECSDTSQITQVDVAYVRARRGLSPRHPVLQRWPVYLTENCVSPNEDMYCEYRLLGLKWKERRQKRLVEPNVKSYTTATLNYTLGGVARSPQPNFVKSTCSLVAKASASA